MVHLTAAAGVLALSFIAPAQAAMRGLPWATDNRWSTVIGSKPKIQWYHHWQDGPISQLASKEYVPQFWGPAKWSQWNSRVSEMNAKKPQHLMAFNEPDISSQSGLDPNYAAQLYMEQIQPWGNKGVSLGSPAIVWKLDWMQTFLNGVKNRGGRVDFICIHWYGSWNDLAGFKKYVQSVRSQFNKPIWVTEMGITSGSYPSQAQVKSFMMNALSWLDSQSYVERVAWFGCFAANNPPDGFATGLNALIQSGGALSDMGFWYGYSSAPDRRSHRAIARDLAAADNATTVEITPVHCDEICFLRNLQIEQCERELAARGLSLDDIE